MLAVASNLAAALQLLPIRATALVLTTLVLLTLFAAGESALSTDAEREP
jgi:hypothetical protein